MTKAKEFVKYSLAQSRSNSLENDNRSTSQYSAHTKSSESTVFYDTSDSHAIWVEIAPGKHVVHKIKTVDEQSELRQGRIPKEWFNHVSRTLKTLILAGTFMAGVEAQTLCLIFTALPSLEKTMAVCFGLSALFLTTTSALYCAVAYLWLRQEWEPKTHLFEEWVTGCIGSMMKWCAVSLVAGVYCGFLAIVCFQFAIINHIVATICTCVFVFCSAGPLLWGYYKWHRLYYGVDFKWYPTKDGPVLCSPRKAPANARDIYRSANVC